MATTPLTPVQESERPSRLPRLALLLAAGALLVLAAPSASAIGPLDNTMVWLILPGGGVGFGVVGTEVRICAHFEGGPWPGPLFPDGVPTVLGIPAVGPNGPAIPVVGPYVPGNVGTGSEVTGTGEGCNDIVLH
jgi:hypothetical protein